LLNNPIVDHITTCELDRDKIHQEPVNFACALIDVCRYNMNA